MDPVLVSHIVTVWTFINFDSLGFFNFGICQVFAHLIFEHLNILNADFIKNKELY